MKTKHFRQLFRDSLDSFGVTHVKQLSTSAQAKFASYIRSESAKVQDLEFVSRNDFDIKLVGDDAEIFAKVQSGTPVSAIKFAASRAASCKGIKVLTASRRPYNYQKFQSHKFVITTDSRIDIEKKAEEILALAIKDFNESLKQQQDRNAKLNSKEFKSLVQKDSAASQKAKQDKLCAKYNLRPKDLKRVTSRKYGGDDSYSWAVFIDNKPFVTGLTAPEISHYKNNAYERIAKEKV